MILVWFYIVSAMILLGFYSWSLLGDAKQAAKERNIPGQFSSQTSASGQVRYIREFY